MTEITFRELTDNLMRLYDQHDYAGALALVDENAGLFPEQTARTTFWKLCLLSLCNRPDDVISVLRQGLDGGLWWAEKQFSDPDLGCGAEIAGVQGFGRRVKSKMSRSPVSHRS